MHSYRVAVCIAWLSHCAVAQQLASFGSAVASSTHSSGGFPATDALGASEGYWCSSGNHAPGERVTWTGHFAVAQATVGVAINWAYGPGEVRILTSADGGNFEEAVGWRAATRPEVSYEEFFMFDAPKKVKALAIVMRSPKPWGFFGVNAVSALTQPGPFMLVASGSMDGKELCLVAKDETVGVNGCLDAMASGSGMEVFNINSASQIVSALTGKCISLAHGDLGMGACADGIDAGDGRSTFVPTSTSRVETTTGYCLSASLVGAAAVPCAEDEGGVAMEAVPAVDHTAAALVKDTAQLLHAAVARQMSLLGQLKGSLQECHGLVATMSVPDQAALSQAAAETSGSIDAAFEVDLAAVKALIAESKALISSA